MSRRSLRSAGMPSEVIAAPAQTKKGAGLLRRPSISRPNGSQYFNVASMPKTRGLFTKPVRLLKSIAPTRRSSSVMLRP